MSEIPPPAGRLPQALVLLTSIAPGTPSALSPALCAHGLTAHLQFQWGLHLNLWRARAVSVLLPLLSPTLAQCLTNCRYSLNIYWINEWRKNISLIKAMACLLRAHKNNIDIVFPSTTQEKGSLTYEHKYQVRMEPAPTGGKAGSPGYHSLMTSAINHPNNSCYADCTLSK